MIRQELRVWWEPFINQIARLAANERMDMENDDDFLEVLAMFTGMAQLN